MTESNTTANPARKWVTYRPEIKLIDCTIRDGGLMNDHQFDDQTVKAVYTACVAGGIDYMEIGYINSRDIFSPKEYGPWKFSSEEDIRRIVGENDTPLKLCAMADAEKSDYKKDILPADQSVLDMIRIATYIHQIPLALEMIQDAHEKGYETSLNLMAASTVPESKIDEALNLLVQSDVDAIYVVDSFGSLYSEQIEALTDKFLNLAHPSGKQVGIHAHNNQQLAFANTIQGLIRGANYLDASMAGLGRGAGNCAMELLVGFLHNPKLRLRPLLDCIQNAIEPLRSKLMWGFDIPYMITGLMNQHPRAGMSFNASKDRGNIVKFYDELEDLE
jgi:4-hydroxy 2-oxovalerate aldolase